VEFLKIDALEYKDMFCKLYSVIYDRHFCVSEEDKAWTAGHV
jgi:hypothetical protein